MQQTIYIVCQYWKKNILGWKLSLQMKLIQMLIFTRVKKLRLVPKVYLMVAIITFLPIIFIIIMINNFQIISQVRKWFLRYKFFAIIIGTFINVCGSTTLPQLEPIHFPPINIHANVYTLLPTKWIIVI